MKRSKKRRGLIQKTLSWVLTLSILFGSTCVPIMATEAVNEVNEVSTDELTVQGTNSIGKLLSSDIQKQQAELEENNSLTDGYGIIDLVVDGNIATVTYTALENTSVVVGIYTEDGSQLLNSGTCVVSAEETVVEVQLEGTMPEYFLAMAYLLDGYDFSPLCAAYKNPLYTEAMQELLASTVEDYDEDLVLNLDDDDSTNFAVYLDTVNIIHPVPGKNKVVSADYDKMIYVIDNADASFTSLRKGDVVAYEYTESDVLILKVGAISVSGDTVTIIGNDFEVDEVFAHVKVENISDSSDLSVIPGTGDEDVTYQGVWQEQRQPQLFAPLGAARPMVEGGVTTTVSHEFGVNKKINSKPSAGNDQPASVTIKGLLRLKIEVQFAYYVTWEEQYVKLQMDAGVEVEFSVSGQAKVDVLKLPSMGASPVPGVYIGIEPKLELQFSASVSWVSSYTFTVGFKYDHDGVTDLSSPPKSNSILNIEGSIFFGIDLHPHIKVVGGAVLEISLSGLIGLELSAKMIGSDFAPPMEGATEIHTCKRCLDGELHFKMKFGLEMEFLKVFDVEVDLFELKFKLLDFYWSFDENRGGVSDCPLLMYQISVLLVDTEGVPQPNVEVNVGAESAVTDKNGIAVFFLKPEEYLVTASVGDRMAKCILNVHRSRNLKLKLDTVFTGQFDGFGNAIGVIIDSDYIGTCGENLSWVLIDGVLTISGEGEMKDYYIDLEFDIFESVAPWFKVRDEIHKVIIENGVTSIGAWAFYDCENLISVEIPDTVEKIGGCSFFYCNKLSAISISAYVNSIATDAFVVSGIENISVDPQNEYYYSKGNCLVSMDGELLKGCSNSVIPNDGRIKRICWAAFYGCDITSVVIPDSVEIIDSLAFYQCSELRSLTIGKGVSQIGYGAFGFIGTWRYDGVDVLVDADNKVYHSAGNCIIDTEAREVVVGFPNSIIPNDESVKSIGEYAFYGTIPDVLVIPNNVYELKDYAFAGDWNGCSTLVISEGVKVIGFQVFTDVIISKVVFLGDAPQMNKWAFAGLWLNFNMLAYYPQGNETWTEEYRDGIGNVYRWTPYEPGKLPIEIEYPPTYLSAAYSVESGSLAQIGGSVAEPPILFSIFGGNYYEEYYDYIVHYANFTDLVPGEEYVLLVMADQTVENPLVAENLLYIAQSKANEYGELTFAYLLREEVSTAYIVACGASNMNLKDATISYSGIYDGEMHIIDPEVYYDGNLLIEGQDYIVLGDVTYTEIGEYTYYIRGIHKYTGLVECNYEVCEHVYSKGLEYTSNGDGTCYVSGIGTCTDTDISIPHTSPLGDRVTAIGAYAFNSCKQITSVVIPDSVTSIGECAFYYCNNIVSITIPASVTTIELAPIMGCSALESIIIAEDNPIYHCAGNCIIESATQTLIAGCNNSALPNDGSIASIGRYAFYGCDGLTNVTIPNGVKSIGSNAFAYCAELIAVTLPDSVTVIDDYAFFACYSLAEIKIPAGVTEIGWNPFAACSVLMQLTVSEKNPIYRSSDNCIIEIATGTLIVALNSTGFPDDDQITQIGSVAFANRYDLESLVLPERITEIGLGAFYDCKYLKSIIIPKNVTFIDAQAFQYCNNLTQITIENPNCEITNGSIQKHTEIHGYLNSTAQIYANENGNQFVELPYMNEEFVLGDIDGNEFVDLDDCLALFQYSMFPDIYPVEYSGNMDYDHNGVVDLDDCLLLFQYSMFPDIYPIS